MPFTSLRTPYRVTRQWWDIRGAIYYELLNQDRTITADTCKEQLDRSRAVLAERTIVVDEPQKNCVRS